MANNTYTFVGSEIRPISGIEDTKILSAKYIYDDEYIKYNQDLSISNLHDIFLDLRYIIDNLRSRITDLEGNISYEVSVSLNNLTCADLSNLKTLKPEGGTFTITANSGYSLPSTVTVTNAEHTWVQSTGVLTISNVIGNVNISATGVANLPTSIKIYNEAGTSELNTTQTITGTRGTVKIKVKVTGDKTLLSNNSKFKVTTIPSGITVKNGSTTVTTSTVLNTDTVLTISGSSVMSAAANLVVTATAKTSLTDSLSVKVNEGSISSIIINPTSHTFNANGESKEFTATLVHNMFNNPNTSSGFDWTIDGTNKDMFSGTSTSNSISITSSKNDDSVNTKSATLSVKYTHNNIDINSNPASLTINKQSVSYYWYVGTEKLTSDAQIESNGTRISNASEITNPLVLDSDEFVYFYYPKAFGKATLTQSGLAAAGKDVAELTGVSLTNYYGWRFPKGNKGGIINIKF